MRTNTKFNVRCVFSVLSFWLVSISTYDTAVAQFWFEDFTDESLDDAGIEWDSSDDRHGRVITVSTEGLFASTDATCCAAWLAPEWPRDRAGWSIRTRGRLLQEHGWLAAGTSEARTGGVSTWSFVSADGNGLVGVADQWREYVPTDLRPFEEEVTIQLDTFDGLMRLWAWRDDEQPGEDIAPLLEEPYDLPDSRPYVSIRSGDGGSAALFSWLAISTEHMPVNMAVPLTDLIGDFSGNDMLDIADIDLLTAQIDSPSSRLGFDISGDGTVDDTDLAKWRSDAATHNGFGEPYLVGDSNLDGMVNAADLNNLALNWGADVSSWSAGDFNADGRISALDLNGLAVNWGRSIPIAATVKAPVPEPSAVLLTLVGLTMAWGLRRRS